MTAGLNTRWVAECFKQECKNLEPVNIPFNTFNLLGDEVCRNLAKSKGYTIVYGEAACREHAHDLRFEQARAALLAAKIDAGFS